MSSVLLNTNVADDVVPTMENKVGTDGISEIGKQISPSDSPCINLVQTPVQIGPTDIELELYKCYDAGKPGFWRRASFSLWMSGVTTLLTTGLSFISFLNNKANPNASWCDFFTEPMKIQVGMVILYLVVGGIIEQANTKHKQNYIGEVMKRYKVSDTKSTS
jgi:hypothetical protein